MSYKFIQLREISFGIVAMPLTLDVRDILQSESDGVISIGILRIVIDVDHIPLLIVFAQILNDRSHFL